MKKHLEIITFEHKGINVTAKIDYDKGDVSFVELLHANGETQATKKHWIFANRGLEYMKGWLNIIEAMKFATEECKKLLEKDLAEKSRLKEGDILLRGLPKDWDEKPQKNIRKRK